MIFTLRIVTAQSPRIEWVWSDHYFGRTLYIGVKMVADGPTFDSL